MKYFSILIMSVFIFSACSSQTIVAPPDNPIILATSDMKCVKTAEKTDWYFFFGLTNSGKRVLSSELLTDVNKPVKIEVTTTFADALLTLFTGLATFVPETTIVYECSQK